MPGQKISSLTPVSDLQAADQLVLARSGSTYKITGDKFASKTQLDSLSATADASFIPKPASASDKQVLTYNGSTATWVASAAAPLLSTTNSPTIDLSYNTSTGTLSANVTTSYLLSSNFTGTNQSFATSGYQKLPGGLIIQWGFGLIDALPGSYYKNITLPIAFPTGGLAVVFHGGIDDTTPPTMPGSLYFLSASTLQGRVYEGQSQRGYWIALGY